jgi:hypothetical protein
VSVSQQTGAPALTAGQLDTLRHMLGINTPNDRAPNPYRNYYAANPGDTEMAALAALGMVECYLFKTSDHFPGPCYDYFRCTEAGQLAAMRSHRTIRRSRASRRYSRFLDIRDVYPDLTFSEFLTDDRFAEARGLA